MNKLRQCRLKFVSWVTWLLTNSFMTSKCINLLPYFRFIVHVGIGVFMLLGTNHMDAL